MPTAVKLSETGTKTLQCTNPLCPAKELCKFARFVSKAGLDIDGLAQETIAKFVSNGWIKTFADIFRLVKHIDEISAMEGFGVKSAQNIASSLEKSRIVKPEKFLVALSIPGCGQDVAKKLLSAYPLRELLSVARQTDDLNVFSEIEGIGPVKSSQFVSWCKEEKNISDTEDLFTEIELEQPTISPQGTKCAGLVFVVTGEVSHFSNREEFKEYVVSQGGKVSSAVSAKTSFLVNNDVESLSGKNQKAKKLGVPIISEDEFLRRFG
jgi:DNA ligase (NAD+)